MTRSCSRVLAALAAGGLLLATACGTPAPAAAVAPAGDTSAVLATAAENLAPYLTQPTAITIDQPLTQRPPTGKKVYWLEGNIQSILPLTGGFTDATAALGWQLTVLTYDPTDPQGPGAAMQQAVAADADYIAVSGQTAAVLGAALDAAKAAGIPVIELFSTDEVSGPTNGIYANIGSPEFSKRSVDVLADFVIGDSAGDANVLFVNVPDFAILRIIGDEVTRVYQQECLTCALTPLDVSTSDMAAGNVASTVVSRLQADPAIDYVQVAIGDLATGLPEALASAGLADRVKIVGSVPNQEQLQSLIDGTSAAYTVFGRPEAGWQAVDAMARLSVGMDPAPADHVFLPLWLLTPQTVPTPAQDYAGTTGHDTQFRTLWQLG
jgi:ABC-type sugar transport system substrate-binding protein